MPDSYEVEMSLPEVGAAVTALGDHIALYVKHLPKIIDRDQHHREIVTAFRLQQRLLDIENAAHRDGDDPALEDDVDEDLLRKAVSAYAPPFTDWKDLL